MAPQDARFDVNALETSSQATLLHHAAINSKMRVLEYLASEFGKEIDVDALGGTEMQTTPLFWAAYHNHIYAVELLLRIGASASFTDEAGFCAFLVAIQRCYPILAAYLVAKGTHIDVRVQDDAKRTALMLLCQRQRFHLDSFRMVLSLGADINAKDMDGNTGTRRLSTHATSEFSP
jgi:ankyrin repeat protein